MLTNPISDIRAIVGVYPKYLRVSSVRTKKICIQDILSDNDVKGEYYIPVYEPPKLLDLIKSSMISVIQQDLNKDISESEEQSKKERQLSEIAEALKQRGITLSQSMPSIAQNISMPSTVDIPVASYKPYNSNTPQSSGIMGIENIIPIIQPGHALFPPAPNIQQAQPLPQQYAEVSTNVLRNLSFITDNLRDMMREASSDVINMVNSIHNDIELNRQIIVKGKRYMVDAVYVFSKVMSKSLADYIRGMVISLIENGCTYMPTGIAGVLDVQIINNTPIPQAIAFSNVVVKSMNYTLSNPRPFTVFAAPSETDIVHVPIVVENINAVDYILHTKDRGVIPITLEATIGAGPIKQTVTFAEGNVEIK